MRKGNVLVIGNSGVGKSTLINAVLGDDVAKVGHNYNGTTNKLEIYENNDNEVPFRVIDTIGFEPGFMKEQRAVNAVKKWSKECAKVGAENHQINVIWFCVDGTSRKLFPKTIKTLIKSVSFWKTIPIIVVITKSYSVPERTENIEMVRSAFAAEKNSNNNRLRKIIPVVAAPYVLNDDAFAPPEGISELISATNELMPEGLSAAEEDLSKFILKRKRALAQATIGTAIGAGALVASTRTDASDAALLSRTESMEINAIAKIYGIKKSEKNIQLFNALISKEKVNDFAKNLLSTLKAIPELEERSNGLLNAAVAGAIIAGLGETATYVFEQIFLGKESSANVDWVQKVLDTNLNAESINKLLPYLDKIPNSKELKELMENIINIVSIVVTVKAKKK